MYTIIIQFPIGMSVLYIDAHQSDWVLSVKAKIQDKTGVPPDQMRLYWHGEEVQDYLDLAYYNIQKEDTLQLGFAPGARQSWTSDEDTCRLYNDERTMYVISGSESTGRMADYEWDGEHATIRNITEWLTPVHRFYIQTLVFDAGVAHIGDYAFVECNLLHTVYNYATTPQNINSSVFASTDISSCTLYVPASSVPMYKTADVWKDFGSIQALPAPVIASGRCGDNLTWSLDTDSGVLLITGSGAMDSYSDYSDVPWNDYSSKIRSLSLPAEITSIGNYAFSGCYNLNSIEIPNSVTSIGNSVFQNCSLLTSVEIPNSVTSMGNNVFQNCSRLTQVTIPNSVTSIGNSMFQNCSLLTSIEIPNSVTSIGYRAFAWCSRLTAIEIPNSVTSIGNQAFCACYMLPSIIIPNNVTSIGEAMFQSCGQLTSVTIPNSVTSIGSWAFSGCRNLNTVTNYATVPQSISSNVFYESPYYPCTLYVPQESIELYESASEWEYFGSILAIPGTEPEEPADEAITANEDPESPGIHYATFYDSANKYLLPAGVEAYVAEVGSDVLNLTRIAVAGQTIPNGTAVILKASVASFTLTPSDADPVTFTATNSLLGVDAATAAPAGCYVLSGHSSDNSVQGVGFYQFTGTLKAHRAYLVIGGGGAGAPKRLRFVLNNEQTATGFENVQGDKVPSTKVVENGTLYIIRGDMKYNAQGQIVK